MHEPTGKLPLVARGIDVQMYKYPLGSSQNWPTQSHTLQLFATAGYQQAEPLSVPEPKSLMTVYWSILVANMKELHMLVSPPNASTTMLAHLP